MKKTLLVTIVCAMFTAGAVYGQTQSIAFDDLGLGGGAGNEGTYSPGDSFSFDVILTFAGYNSPGYSLWLETQTGLAPFISITAISYFKFTDSTDEGVPKAFNDTSGQSSSSFLTDDDTVTNPDTGTFDQGDLGATSPIATPGSYKILHITFQLSGAPVGNWALQSTTTSPKVSIVTDSTTNTANNIDRPLGQTIYSITIIPEPSTLALIGVTAVAGAIIARRRRALRG
jgi:hypothetical protein